jgi:hypothetical protein
MKIITIFSIMILFILLLFGKSNATPIINSVPNTMTDGQSGNVFGSGFGTHTLTIEWLGGSSGNIEQGVVGNTFSKTNWTAPSSPSYQQPQYSSTMSHSGTKSIKAFFTNTNQYDSWMYWDSGGTITKFYATWWAYMYWPGTQICTDTKEQWKMWRLRGDTSVNDVVGEIMSSDWYVPLTGAASMNYVSINCAEAYNNNACHPSGKTLWSTNSPGIQVIQPGKWQRIELIVEASSSPGTRDGKLIYQIYHTSPNSLDNIKNYTTDVMTPLDTGISGKNFRYFHFQNYIGFGDAGCNTNVGPALYLDDIYIQNGTQARVELCDSNTWLTRKHCEIQPVTSWNNSTIGVSFNKGSFQSGSTAYLYVVDSNGNVNSQGYSVTISSSIAPPVNLRKTD